MEALLGVTRPGTLLLGVCIPSLRHNASKFRVQQLDFDAKLNEYFKKHLILYAYDPNKISKFGDIVLIEKLPKRISTTIDHKVLEVVYPCGDITDPITGKKVVGKEYRFQKKIKEELFGKSPSGFNYEAAPERGSQENIRDFSHRIIYKKFHEYQDGDDNKDHPHERPY